MNQKSLCFGLPLKYLLSLYYELGKGIFRPHNMDESITQPLPQPVSYLCLYRYLRILVLLKTRILNKPILALGTNFPALWWQSLFPISSHPTTLLVDIPPKLPQA